MAGVGVANLKRDIVHTELAGTQKFAPSIHLGVHHVAIHSTVVYFFEPCFEPVFIEPDQFSQFGNSGWILPLIQDQGFCHVDFSDGLFVFQKGAGNQVRVWGVEVFAKQLNQFTLVHHLIGIVV